MNIGPETPVGELAARFPFVVRILEDAQVDYHTAGARPFREACRRAEAPFDRMLSLVQAETQRRREIVVDWLTEPLDVVMSHITEGHHAFSRRLCADIQSDLTEALGVHIGRASLAKLAVKFSVFAEDLLRHFQHEEAMVFRYVAALGRQVLPQTPYPSLGGPTGILEFEHEDVEHQLEGLRDLTDGYMPPPGACPALRGAIAGLAVLERDLHEHLHLENNVLFPRARELERALAPR